MVQGQDFIRGASTHLFQFSEWPVVSFEIYAWYAPMLDLTLDDGAFPPATPRTGADAISPGDITGNGADDLVLLEDTSVGHEFGNVLVFPGPLIGPDVAIERGYDDDDTIVLTVPGVTHGAPCGDLNADGVDDLCLSSGIILGPVTSSSTIDLPMEGGILRQNSPSTSSVGFLRWDADARELSLVEGVGLDSELVVGGTSGGLDQSSSAWFVSPGSDATTVLYAYSEGQEHFVNAIRVGEATPFLTVATGDLAEEIAYADVTGDGVRDVVAAAASVLTVWDGAAALGGRSCAAGTIRVPTPDSGLGEEMLVAELHGGGHPELVIGAPREIVETDGGPGALGSTYLLRLPLDPSTIER